MKFAERCRELLGDNGWLNRRMKYVKSCQKATDAIVEQIQCTNIAESQNAEEDLQWLKRSVIKNVNDPEYVLKLNSTQQLRKRLMAKDKTDIREMFPFFLSHPELVSVQYIV